MTGAGVVGAGVVGVDVVGVDVVCVGGGVGGGKQPHGSSSRNAKSWKLEHVSKSNN